ncbi:MAG: hypothetical protein ETSY1_10010 [Candidatus Entotheonella factor]|uniref:histidine kinase n=1 Tax=Entotheonella factor TaxID=1429438 RepID=W4LRY2_ENTF1|nr:MAG: hypothetical protein ETSY1_10010 [Candidatus Entotheonella factor]
MKDTTTYSHRTLSWPCLCAYLLLAFFIVFGLYVGLNWQFLSAVDHAGLQPLPQPPDSSGRIWLFTLAFLTMFAGTVFLHHLFVSIALKRLRASIADEQRSTHADEASVESIEDLPAEADMPKELEQGMSQQVPSLTQAIDDMPDPSRVQSAFLTTMRHEIRTPMNGIIGMTNKLLETSLNDDQHQYMMMIQEATHALTKIIDDILDFSKLETQQLQLEYTSFNLIQTIESCLDWLAEQAQAKQLAFYFCVMSGVPQQVCGDAGRLRQVLYNLLANAIKLTHAGTVAISVSGELEDDNRVNLSFEIHDTDMGIDSAVIPNLFEESSQSDVPPTPIRDDAELGLIISKQLTRLMQGRIDVKSLPGTGTIWRLNVSLDHCPDHEASDMLLPLHHVQVVYVDGSELNSRLFCNQFASWGMAPTAIADANSVISVLNTAMKQAPSLPLVVIRHDPPALNGYELCREIRQSEAAATAKILLLTARREEPTPLETSAPLFDLSLTFPIHATALYHALRQLVNHPTGTTSTCEQTSLQSADQASAGAVLNILLVEDNRVNQQVALTMLKKWGHRIDVAWNGLEALEAVQRQDYDLVLMDIQMPEMDGVTATQQIRQLDGTCASVPIVAVTANAMQGDREHFLSAGMDDYIAKPIDRDTFHMVVHRYAPQNQSEPVEMPEETTVSEPTTPLLGDEVLSYLRNELSGETVSELIDEYMTHSASLLSQALVASEEQDAKNVEYAVHTLKGMSGALGALRMVDICQHILETCRNEGTQQIERQMNGLSGTTEETQQALQAWRSEQGEEED